METLSLLAQELAVGSLMALAPLALRRIPGGFASLIAHLAAGFWGVAGVVALRLPPAEGAPPAALLFGLALASLFFARASLAERHGAARALLAAVVLTGSILIVGDGGRLAARVPDGGLPAALVAMSLLASALSLGSALTTMILGHWYLIPPPLPFTHLIRGALLFLVACGVRAAVSIACVASHSRETNPAVREAFDRLTRIEGDVMFLALRVFWGLIGPLVLGFLVLRTARLHSNQSATGLLYVSVVFVLIGELLANFLLVHNSLPL